MYSENSITTSEKKDISNFLSYIISPFHHLSLIDVQNNHLSSPLLSLYFLLSSLPPQPINKCSNLFQNFHPPFVPCNQFIVFYH
jgi:hypothetical protein